MSTATHHTTLEILGTRFVLLPEVDYLKLMRAADDGVPLDPALLDLSDLVDADAYMAEAVGRTLRKARETAGLTQVQLAKKLHKSQALVSAAERGTTEVGSRYLAAVLKGCGLPLGWKPGNETVRESKRPNRFC